VGHLRGAGVFSYAGPYAVLDLLVLNGDLRWWLRRLVSTDKRASGRVRVPALRTGAVRVFGTLMLTGNSTHIGLAGGPVPQVWSPAVPVKEDEVSSLLEKRESTAPRARPANAKNPYFT
jgi:hypothetical protein